MAKAGPINFVFDLDGTIAAYGRPIGSSVKRILNALAKQYDVYIVTGGQSTTVSGQTQGVNAACYALGDENHRVNCAKIAGVSKRAFNNDSRYQDMRIRLVEQLREVWGNDVYLGGRATIDIMNTTKADVLKRIGGKIVYFYDCKWPQNEPYTNDVPAINLAWKAIKTDSRRVAKDIQKCLKTLS